jgi:hypothetical protein
MTGPLLEGLPPIAHGNARMLLLGNMPSVMSLAAQQYYANPRNGFWRIAGDIFGFEATAAYDERTAALCARGVAVWDVLRLCRDKAAWIRRSSRTAWRPTTSGRSSMHIPQSSGCSSTVRPRRRTLVDWSVSTARCAIAGYRRRAPPKPCDTRTS